jgi:hypothetical protein
VFVSSSSAYFTAGVAGYLDIIATGMPTPSLTETGTLPGGLIFLDNGNGTGLLVGAPYPGTEGEYLLTFGASNGARPDAVQSFMLIVY